MGSWLGELTIDLTNTSATVPSVSLPLNVKVMFVMSSPVPFLSYLRQIAACLRVSCYPHQSYNPLTAAAGGAAASSAAGGGSAAAAAAAN